MRKRRAQQSSASNGAREQPAAATAIDHVFSAQIAAAGRSAEISSDYANIDHATPSTPPKPTLWSKPLSRLGRRIKSVPRKTRRSVVEYVPLASILPNPINPRKHSRQQIEAIAHSIEAFGFNAPILVDGENRVVAGHARLEAARLLGLQEVPVFRLDHLTEAQAKAYMLADNKLTDHSDWDDGKVAIVLKELSDIALNFEIEATGFEAPEIDLRIQSLESHDESTDSADDFETADGPAVSRLDDLWTLGSHRLLCGSALDSHAYGTLFAGEKAAAAFADPPYNVRVKGHVSGKGARKHREFPMAAGELTEDAFCRFLQDAFNLMVSHSVEGATFFACMDWRHVFEMVTAIRALGCAPLNLCVWVKTNGGMGSLYRSRHELVFVFGRRGATRVNNVQLGRHGRNRTNVWNYPGMNSFARRGRTRGLDLHPTVKPITMVSDAILDVTQHGDIVLDPFCGSGTTILAAERTGRRGYAIELDPGHVDTAIARWERMTKQTAVHASGKTFEEMRAERRSEDGWT
jgi:DNA modification methylase